MKMKLTAVFEKVPEGYIAFVEELPGANTQGDTIEEARANLQEAVELSGSKSSARRRRAQWSVGHPRIVCYRLIVKRRDVIRHGTERL